MQGQHPRRHHRACPGDLDCVRRGAFQTGMAGTNPAMTGEGCSGRTATSSSPRIELETVRAGKNVDSVQPGASAILDKLRLVLSELAPFCRMNKSSTGRSATSPRAAQARLSRHMFASLESMLINRNSYPAERARLSDSALPSILRIRASSSGLG